MSFKDCIIAVVERVLNLPVTSILKLDDLIAYLERSGNSEQLTAVRRYRAEYGIAAAV